ncbi:MAG: peptidylprolyl isomerase [Actinomycetota bacterium]|nr:peptidylprolyl isomerase [Actinomycetota bacterium]
MPSQAELKKRRVKAGKQKIRQEVVIDRRERRRRLVVGSFVALLALALIAPLVGGIFLAGDDGPPQVESITPDTPTDTAPADPDDAAAAADLTDALSCPAEDGSSPRTITFAEPHPMCINTSMSYVAVFDTSEGEIRVTLNTAETPITVNNFVTLARWGYYDGTTIFRSDPSIDIIQGGAPRTESPSDPGPGYTIPDEPQFEETSAGIVGPYRYVPGQLVMARTALPNSSSAQYFFTTGENAARLDGQGVYVVFGKTDEAGLGVLQSIIGLHEPGGALGGEPSRTVTVNSVTIEVS